MKLLIPFLILLTPTFAFSERVQTHVLLSCSSKTESLEIRESEGSVTFEVTYRDRGTVTIENEVSFQSMTSESNVAFFDLAVGYVNYDESVRVHLLDSKETEIKIYPKLLPNKEYAVHFETVSGNPDVLAKLIRALFPVFGQSYARCK